MEESSQVGQLEEKFEIVDWGDIKHFFVWERRSVVVINKVGMVKQIILKKGDKVGDYVKLWLTWSKHLKANEGCNSFEYPTWVRIQDIRRAYQVSVFMMLSILTLSVIFACGPSAGVKSAYLFLLLSALIGVSLLFLACEVGSHIARRKYAYIGCALKSIKVTLLDGTMREFSFDQVEHFSFDTATKHTFIRFADGTCLRYLERLSYWPILRDLLLSNLQGSPKEA